MTDVPAAEPVFRADGTLFAPRFSVVYHQVDGLGESRHVFLDGNGLADRLRRCRRFSIGETGFGTGLNFLAAWQLFRQVAPRDARLCYTTVEGFPLEAATLRRALARFSELGHLAAELVEGWRPMAHEFERRTFDDGRVVLCVLRGDAGEVLPRYRFSADAWFLDGFAPARNPQMWSEAVLRAVAARTRVGGTLATFTVAGSVRRGLAAGGFELATRPGFGNKREMLTGTLRHAGADATVAWLRLPDRPPPTRVSVIGAGIAGAAAARALAERGVRVDVVDRSGIAAGASGQGLAVLQPRLGHDPDARFVRRAFDFARRMVLRIAPETFAGCGALHPAFDAQAEGRLRRRLAGSDDGMAQASWLDADGCDERAGVTLAARGGVWLPAAGVVRGAELCVRLLDHPAIRVVRGTAEQVEGARVLAHAAAAAALLPMRAVPGQQTPVEADGMSPPRCVISHGAHVTPAIDGVVGVGATYRLDAADRAPRDEDDDANLVRAVTAVPALAPLLTARRRASWVGIRATTVDRLPYVGPLPDAAALVREHAAAWRTGMQPTRPEPAFVRDTFVSLAHGSRGFATGPFAGEIIAAMMCGEPVPLEEELLVRVLPVRALVREHRRAPRRDLRS